MHACWQGVGRYASYPEQLSTGVQGPEHALQLVELRRLGQVHLVNDDHVGQLDLQD